MKRFIAILFIFLSVNIFVFGQNITPPNHKLNQSEIEGKSISELWLLRNSIFAKHGRPFKTYELHAYFKSQSWYKLTTKFKSSDLSSTDTYNVNLLYKQETKIRNNNYLSSGKVNFDNIYNIFQYPKFNDYEQNLLEKNGFVVLPTDKQQMFHIYENNDYLGIPSFISVDAVLQLYHLYFDMTLRTIEEKFLYPKLEILINQLISELLIIKKTTNNQQIIQAIDFELAHLGVAQNLIKGQNVPIKGKYKDLAKQEVANCNNHSGWQDSPLFKKKYDYSQYIPRGHYTRNETLKKFFKSMMWLGNSGIELEKEQNILSAVILTHVLYNKTYQNKALIELWKDIYEPTVFYVGLADDTGPVEIKKEIDNVFASLKKIEQFDDSKKLLQLAKNLPSEKISGHGSWGKQKKQFRFMGQRFVPDSYIFDRLTSTKRKMPNSLDIMAGFGNKMALKLMTSDFKASWAGLPEYPTIMQEIIQNNKQKSEAEWKQNLYYHWLYNIISLFDIKDKTNLPFFMTTEGYQQKTLNTSLSSWAELRHNTILFAKQSYAAECGGDGYEEDKWIPGPPKGYVEPNIEFYNRMLSLMNFTIDGLIEREMLDNRIKYIGKEFVDLLTFLKSISEKEIRNEKVENEEYIQIQKLGSLLDNLTLRVLTNGYIGWDDLEGPDKNMPVIADVHTADGSALEVGVGKAHEIYVIVELNGKLRLTRGAIFSYYEFHHPISDRLTDEKWQKMLNEGSAPQQPSWIKYKSKAQKGKVLNPLFKPKDPQTPDYSTKPGWNVIYYDTGC